MVNCDWFVMWSRSYFWKELSHENFIYLFFFTKKELIASYSHNKVIGWLYDLLLSSHFSWSYIFVFCLPFPNVVDCSFCLDSTSNLQSYCTDLPQYWLYL